MFTIGIGIGIGYYPSDGSTGGGGAPGNIYLRPDGVSWYYQPDGASFYIRP